MAHASYHPGAVREKETGMRRHPHQPQPNESRLGGISVSTQSEFQRCPPISGAHFDREVLPPISREHFVTETVPPISGARFVPPRDATTLSGAHFDREVLPPNSRAHFVTETGVAPTTPPTIYATTAWCAVPPSIKGCQFQAVVAPTIVAKNRNHRERTTLMERIQFQEPKLEEKNPQDSIPSPR